jgi:CRP/FNR family transcriptional regulator, cyclic AMP receptor protein
MNNNQNRIEEGEPVERNESTAIVERILAEHPFLKGLNPHQMRLLADCAMVTRFQPGETIFREGDPANRFYLILSGKVAIESYVRDQGNKLIQTIGPGDVLGWSWLFPPFYWHFDARALEVTAAVFFYGTPLRAECEADHDLGYEMIRRMSEVMLMRLQATRRQLLELSFPTGDVR